MDIQLSPSSPPAAPVVPQVPTGNTSTNVDGVITAPTVVAPSLPKVEGVDPLDRGDEAELTILHHMVGPFLQGARIMISDLPAAASIDRLVKLGAVALLKGPAEDAPQAPAKGKGK